MKKMAFSKLIIATVAVMVVAGCKSKSPDKNITPIAGLPGQGIEGPGFGKPIGAEGLPVGPGTLGSGEGFPSGFPNTTGIDTVLPLPLPPEPFNPGELGTANMGDFEGMAMDRLAFKPNTIFFDYDSSVVRSSEGVKLDEVIQILRSQPQYKLLVEGHCDERGTEEYNRSLGERRALSVRESLVKAGIPAARVRTMSWGKDKPAEFGHDESSWSRNRRGELVLLRPKL